MSHFFDLLAVLVVLSAVFAYVNHRFVRLPPAIGLMMTSLLLSMALIGLELVVLSFTPLWLVLGLVVVIWGLLSRYLSVWLPAQIIRLRGTITSHTLLILTWGGLRGGISIALALQLTPELGRELWLTLTYMIVAFSVLVQGLTVGRLARRGV